MKCDSLGGSTVVAWLVVWVCSFMKRMHLLYLCLDHCRYFL